MDSIIEISDGDRELNVVIAYDNVEAGKRAWHTLSGLARTIGNDMNVDPELWRFESLEDSELGSLAAAEAIEADILIISAGSKTELPATVKIWVTKCLTQKDGTKSALVALLGTADNFDGPDSPRFQFLQRAAMEAGIDFFAPRWSRTSTRFAPP